MTSSLNSPLRIVLADDDIDDCFIFEEIIKAIPHTIDLTIVHDGEELMKLLSKSTENFPQALFLDHLMPRKNGYECLSEIRANSNFSTLPVVILSSSFATEVADRLYNEGAHYYVRKPSTFSKLEKAIQQVLTQISKNNYSKPPRDEFVLAC